MNSVNPVHAFLPVFGKAATRGAEDAEYYVDPETRVVMLKPKLEDPFGPPPVGLLDDSFDRSGGGGYSGGNASTPVDFWATVR